MFKKQTEKLYPAVTPFQDSWMNRGLTIQEMGISRGMWMENFMGIYEPPGILAMVEAWFFPHLPGEGC